MVHKCGAVKRVRFDLGPSTPLNSNNALSRRVVPISRAALTTPIRRVLKSNQCPNIKKLFDFSYRTVQEFCLRFLKAISVIFFGVFLIPYAVYKDQSLEGASH